MRPSVKKSDAACGAEIVFDLARDIDHPTFQEIERVFHDNIVVVFRGQQLSNERHVEFSRRFGELEIHIVKRYLLPGFPEILLISNVRDQRDERDDRVIRLVFIDKKSQHEPDFDQRRENAVQRIGHELLYPARAAFDIARHAARLAFQMESQRKCMQMPEHLERELPHRAFRHFREQHFAQLREQ